MCENARLSQHGFLAISKRFNNIRWVSPYLPRLLRDLFHSSLRACCLWCPDIFQCFRESVWSNSRKGKLAARDCWLPPSHSCLDFRLCSSHLVRPPAPWVHF